MQTYDGFNEKELNYTSPFEIFHDWFEEAKTEEINDPDAMSLATVNDGHPNVRMVLLKKIDHGFVFFSNKNTSCFSDSAKAAPSPDIPDPTTAIFIL